MFSEGALPKGIEQKVTDIIEELAGGKLPCDPIYSNVVHTVDGTWNMDGRAMTNEQLGEAIAKG